MSSLHALYDKIVRIYQQKLDSEFSGNGWLPYATLFSIRSMGFFGSDRQGKSNIHPPLSTLRLRLLNIWGYFYYVFGQNIKPLHFPHFSLHCFSIQRSSIHRHKSQRRLSLVCPLWQVLWLHLNHGCQKQKKRSSSSMSLEGHITRNRQYLCKQIRLCVFKTPAPYVGHLFYSNNVGNFLPFSTICKQQSSGTKVLQIGD